MMATARASSAIAEIWYYTDYSNPTAPAFRLGTIAEAATDKTLVLVLLGRSRLKPTELERASGFNRQQLEEVWGTLSNIMQEAWSIRPNIKGAPEVGSMLRYLADKYSMSLHFQTPQALTLPKAVVDKAARDPKSLGEAVAKILEKQLKPAQPKVAKALAKKAAGRRVARSAVRRRMGSFRESLVTDVVASL
jgi:hypothetical protein